MTITKCNKIVFHMEEDGKEWEYEIDTSERVLDCHVSYSFLENFREEKEEEITIKLVLLSRLPKHYAFFKTVLSRLR